jgi:hypothetical protein
MEDRDSPAKAESSTGQLSRGDVVLLQEWWQEHSSLTAVLSSARLIWPTFFELHGCIFFCRPNLSEEDWKADTLRRAPAGWEHMPIDERRVVAGRLGELSVNHVVHVMYESDWKTSVDLEDVLLGILLETWPCALDRQYPGREFRLEQDFIDGEGIILRLIETTGAPARN